MLESNLAMLGNRVTELTKALTILTEALSRGSLPATHSLEPTPNPPKLAAPREAPLAKKEDVQNALTTLVGARGKEVALELLAEFDAKKVPDLCEADYQKLIDRAGEILAEPEEAA